MWQGGGVTGVVRRSEVQVSLHANEIIYFAHAEARVGVGFELCAGAFEWVK